MHKNILITGATSGIGKETAILLAQNGFKVFAIQRSEAKYNFENISFYRADITNEQSVKEVFDNLKEIKFDAIINNAGLAISSPVENLKISELQRQFETVLFGSLRITQTFLPNLKKDGKIINLSSMASYGIFPFISPYCASKRALDIIFTSLSIESGHKVVSIKPGAIKTPFWDNSLKENKENFENFKPKYEKEGEFLIKNAHKNSKNALEPALVSKLILKVINDKNPKCSYTVGKDAFFASIFSRLPQNIKESLIKFALKTRIKK